MRYYFAWLGSKRAAKRGVAEPACLLDKAANANLPVPAGGVLLHQFFEMALAEGVIQQENDVITAVSPQELHHLLYKMARFPRLKGMVAIRPLLNDQFGSTIQPINTSDPVALSGSLCEAWRQPTERHDLLLITLPKKNVEGTAVTLPNKNSDTIIIAETKSTISQLERWQKPDASLPPHLQRLQMLLRGLRRTFGDVGWEIEWKDDGKICWLWQFQSS
ncbi:hypothetical protein MNBD_CHLOROFLEXI01-4815 [hydrothermal vent metagenome]|uniref:Pyruvate phosphate dikinase AMP/ATP-binding domain-containing protein n=1 Tax=hydrothermal vent metagenome TaxID=652676 RepID=A0A3B0V105_9ZZZZ